VETCSQVKFDPNNEKKLVNTYGFALTNAFPEAIS
jgi:hypothetical protein